MYALQAGALLDGYWHYLDECGVLRLMADQPVASYQRKVVSIFALTAIYHLKALMGIAAIDSLPALLFSDPVAMSVLGGDGELIRQGVTQRWRKRRPDDTEGVRMMDADVVGDFVGRWSAQEAADYFNGVVAILSAAGAFGRWVRAVMDGSDLHTSTDFTFEHKQWKGLKLLLLWDAFSGLPLAAKVVEKNCYEPQWALSLLRQAERNLGGHARIGEFVADRLYVNGKLLYFIDQEDIVFTVRAKAGMQVREEALSHVAAGRGNRAARGAGEQRLEVAGVEGLQVYDDYNDPLLARQKNRSDYVPEPLNAVVVQRAAKMPAGWEPWVLITNGSVKRPLEAYDRYDDRSLIENLGFREGKQGWYLERSPQRNERAYVTHVFMTLTVYACSAAYRAQCEREAVEEDVGPAAPLGRSGLPPDDGEPSRRPKEAIRHYRKRLALENRDNVWIRVGETYGIFHLAELSVLTGIRLKQIPPEVGTREQIFRRYGLESPS